MEKELWFFVIPTLTVLGQITHGTKPNITKWWFLKLHYTRIKYKYYTQVIAYIHGWDKCLL